MSSDPSILNVKRSGSDNAARQGSAARHRLARAVSPMLVDVSASARRGAGEYFLHQKQRFLPMFTMRPTPFCRRGGFAPLAALVWVAPIASLRLASPRSQRPLRPPSSGPHRTLRLPRSARNPARFDFLIGPLAPPASVAPITYTAPARFFAFSRCGCSSRSASLAPLAWFAPAALLASLAPIIPLALRSPLS